MQQPSTSKTSICRPFESNRLHPYFTIQKKEEQQPDKKKNDELPYDMICKICMVAKKDTVLLPCGHTGICAGCSKSFIKKTCPFCRKKVRSVTKVFDV